MMNLKQVIMIGALILCCKSFASGKELIPNGNLARLKTLVNKTSGEQYQIPQDWYPYAGKLTESRVESTKSGNVFHFKGHTRLHMNVPTNATGTYKITIRAKGVGKLKARMWGGIKYSMKTDFRRFKFPSVRLTPEFKDYTFDIKAVPKEKLIILYLAGGDVSISKVSCTLEPESKIKNEE